MPNLSVLMPARNAESSIGVAVRSTLRAMPPDSQLLVHDDASTDRTPQILEELDDPRLRMIRSDHPLGVARGLNRLLDTADSAVVARMDADDITLPWRFRLQLKALRSGAGVVFSTVATFDPSRYRITAMVPVGISAAAMPFHMMLACPVAHSTMCADAEHLHRAGGYRDVPAEDYDLWLRLCTDDVACVRLAAPTLCYRVHQAQVMASPDWQARAAQDPALAESYADVSRRTLGADPTWFAPLRSTATSPSARHAHAEDLRDAIAVASRSLRTAERRFLIAKADKMVRSYSPSS